MIANFASAAVVVFAGLYLVALAAVAILRPANAEAFLLGFAGSARAHYTEMTARLVVGWALVVQGPTMLFGDVFLVFGWVVVATTAFLICIPWKWHRRFAQKAVPPAMPYIRWIGLVSLLIGGTVLAALLAGPAR